MNHETLANYIETNFALMHHHKWDLNYLDELPPYERSIYVQLLSNHVAEMAERARLLQRQQAHAN